MQAVLPVNTDRTVLTDAMWARIESLLPGRKSDPGVTAADSRGFLEAVLWRTRTGSPWRDIPERLGKSNSVLKRFRRWVRTGVFQRVSSALSGDLDLEYAFVDGTMMKVHQKAAGSKKGGPQKGSATPAAGWPQRLSRS